MAPCLRRSYRHQEGDAGDAALAAEGKQDLYAYSADRMTSAVRRSSCNAIAAGEIRHDVTAEDLLRALVGMCHTPEHPGWRKRFCGMVDVFVDGLCRQHGGRRQAT